MGAALRSLIAALLLCAFSGAVYADHIAPASDLRQDAAQSRTEQRPILALVTAAYCEYCEAVKREFFQHMTDDARIILREIDLSSERTLIDFDGRRIGHSEFARRHQSLFTPTALFLDADGESIAKPLVGVATMDYYGFYLDKRIGEVLDVLGGR